MTCEWKRVRAPFLEDDEATLSWLAVRPMRHFRTINSKFRLFNHISHREIMTDKLSAWPESQRRQLKVLLSHCLRGKGLISATVRPNAQYCKEKALVVKPIIAQLQCRGQWWVGAIHNASPPCRLHDGSGTALRLLGKEVPDCNGTRRFVTVFTRARHRSLVYLKHMNPEYGCLLRCCAV
jgi:hypothetical protein